MPKMATVSRMPLAIVSLPSESRGGFPEIAAESAAFVKGFDAEHHPQIGADFEGIVRKVGEFGHHAPAADKIDIAIEIGRIGRIGERIRGPGHEDRKSTRLNSSHSCASRMPSY